MTATFRPVLFFRTGRCRVGAPVTHTPQHLRRLLARLAVADVVSQARLPGLGKESARRGLTAHDLDDVTGKERLLALGAVGVVELHLVGELVKGCVCWGDGASRRRARTLERRVAGERAHATEARGDVRRVKAWKV